MSHKDPEAAARRKNVLSRFARLTVAEQEKRRLKAISEVPNNGTKSQPWLCGEDKRRYEEDQFAYTQAYQDQYKLVKQSSPHTSSYTEEGDENNPINSSAISEISDRESNADTAVSNDTVGDLVTIIPRRRRILGTASVVSSCTDLGRTSTIMQETPEEYSSSISIEELKKDFFHDYKANTELPIYKHRNAIVKAINSYRLVIVEGATGCGKTTQVPIYILEDAVFDGKHVNAPLVYVTCPRRIAAKSIASRICDEHNWTLGTVVGYHIGMDKVVGPQTVLVFCTAGVLLQKLIQEKSLCNYTHIIIDEVHERDADTDLLMMMVRTLMRKESSFFRLIVMSATMNREKLKAYFTFSSEFGHRAATTPSTCIIGNDKQPTNIQVVYYDKIRTTFRVDSGSPEFDDSIPELYDDCLQTAVELIINVIPRLDTFSEATKSTLVFLPGLAEISKLHRLLSNKKQPSIEIIPLHSCITAVDQFKIFRRVKAGCRKVILATNIAESSITVHDVGFVIDFCLTKVLRKDPVTKFPTLTLQWASKDKCDQRKGRTGRCCPGKVFRMVPTSFFAALSDFAEPELLVAPLELSVLRVKNFQMGEIKALFAVVLDPPPFDDIRTAVLELKQIGALTSTYQGKLSDIDGDLTELGRVISSLPVDVHLSKLIVLASLFDVVADAIIVAACLSTNRTVVKHFYGNQLDTYDSKLDWARGSFSDLIVSLEVYKRYLKEKEDGRDERFLSNFCTHHNLDERKLQDVHALVQELKVRLENVNIRNYEQPNRIRDFHEDELMLKIAFCAAFYPNYFLSQELDIKMIEKELGGLDPTKTVIISQIPVNQVPLYRKQILSQLTRVVGDDVDYYADCSRALLMINDDTGTIEDKSIVEIIGDEIIQLTQGVGRRVYLALKSGDMQERICLWEYQEASASSRMDYYRKERQIVGDQIQILLPSLTKLVERPAQNRHLFERDNSTDYVEVQCNLEQETQDIADIYRLERIEEQRIEDIKKSLGREVIPEVEHHIYKPGRKITRGPNSPIQMKFRSVLFKSRGYNVEIDPLSVNSILLDPTYEIHKRQMLVAATVSQSKRGRVLARDTTLMPNIRGLPTLMALMFAQYYRVVYNEQTKSIAGAIFGLGWDDNDEPIDKSYDVELSFDVHVTKHDIDLINEGRRTVSKLFKFIDVQNPGAPMAELQQQLRSIVLALIKKRRYPMNEVSIASMDWSEGEFLKDKHNVPKQHTGLLKQDEYRVFLPTVEITKEYTEEDMYKTIRENLNKLTDIQDYMAKPPIGGIRCLLCSGGTGDVLLIQSKIVDHLHSESHKESLRNFEYFEQRTS